MPLRPRPDAPAETPPGRRITRRAAWLVLLGWLIVIGALGLAILYLLQLFMVVVLPLIIALLLLRYAEWLSRPWLGLALLAGALVAAVVEAVGMVRTRPRLEVAEVRDEP